MDFKGVASAQASATRTRKKLNLGREVIRELTAVKPAGNFDDRTCPAGESTCSGCP
jgi:hypothetical protein